MLLQSMTEPNAISSLFLTYFFSKGTALAKSTTAFVCSPTSLQRRHPNDVLLDAQRPELSLSSGGWRMHGGPRMMWDSVLMEKKNLLSNKKFDSSGGLGFEKHFRMKGVIEVSNMKLNSSGELLDVLGALPGGKLNKAKLSQPIYFLKA